MPKRSRDQYPKGLVGDVVELADFHRENLQEKWTAMVRYWGLYHSKRVDPRSESEKAWRANLVIPRPFANVEAKTATMTNLILGADPIVQVEGVGDEDADFAKGVESLLDFTFRQTDLRGFLPPFLREVAVQGTAYVKLIWDSQAHIIDIPEDPQAVRDYSQKILDATQVAGIPPTGKPGSADFELWRHEVNTAHSKKGINIPDPPKFNKQRVWTYDGPKLIRVSPFDLYCDPLVEQWNNQPQVVHRTFQTKKWLEKRVAEGVYDGKAVEKALSKSDQQKFSEFDEEIHGLLGLQSADGGDPAYRESVELWDVFRPGDEWQHCVVLNRSEIINSREDKPTEMPYRHGRIPVVPVRNVVVPGLHHGISDFQPSEGLFHEMNSLRSLRMDNTVIATIPTLKRLRSAGGIPDLKKHFKPGSIFDVGQMDGLEQFIKQGPPPAAFQEVDNLKAEIDETTGTGENVRGEAATVGRISATDTQSRLNQALSRMKLHAITFESDFSEIHHQAVALWAQYGTTSIRERITGKDPLLALTTADLERAKHVDLRFRGATQAIAKDLVAQQAMMVGEKFLDQMIPAEQRELMKMIWNTLSLRNADKIISDAGTKDLTDAYNLQKQMAQQQAAMAQQQSMMGQVGGPPGSGAPPGGAPGTPQGQPGGALGGGEDDATGEGPAQ